MSRQCPICSANNQDNAVACTVCGASLVAPPPAPPTPPPAPPSPSLTPAAPPPPAPPPSPSVPLAPAAPAAAPAAVATRKSRNAVAVVGASIAIVGSVAMIAGAPLPWLQGDVGLVIGDGSTVPIAVRSGTGLEQGFGALTLLLGLATAVLAVVYLGRARSTKALAVVALCTAVGGFLGWILGWKTMMDQIFPGDLPSDAIRPSMGLGVWLTLGGAIVAMLGAILLVIGAPSAAQRAP